MLGLPAAGRGRRDHLPGRRRRADRHRDVVARRLPVHVRGRSMLVSLRRCSVIDFLRILLFALIMFFVVGWP